jgi:hypothetical protein
VVKGSDHNRWSGKPPDRRLLDEILERHGLRGRWDQWMKLARLPIERKLEILLDLQRTVNEIAVGPRFITLEAELSDL